jgi:hypothetical protein
MVVVEATDRTGVRLVAWLRRVGHAAGPHPAGGARMDAADEAGAARALITLANAAGGPDNISCVVANVVPAAA